MPVNPRKKKIDAICTKIAMFLVNETYENESEIRRYLSKAIEDLDSASTLMVRNDEAADKAEKE